LKLHTLFVEKTSASVHASATQKNHQKQNSMLTSMTVTNILNIFFSESVAVPIV